MFQRPAIMGSMAVAVLGLAGCAVTQPHSAQPVPITDPGQSQTFIFPKTTPTGKSVVPARIVSAMALQFRQMASAPTQSVQAKPDLSAIDVTERWELSLNYNSVKLEYPLHIDDRGNQYAITLECPKVIGWEMRNLSLTGIPQFNMQKVAALSKRMCGAVKPVLDEVAVEKGDVDVAFNSDSVFSNFRRKLSSIDANAWNRYATQNQLANELSIEKSERFMLQDGQSGTPVSISVYPYRNGSKVVYAFGYPYQINPDGSTTYRQAEINALKAKIKSIAND